MNIDFTKKIKQMKEKDVLHKPFPHENGYALFAKNGEDVFVKVLFSGQDQLKKYLNALGYEWGNEGKDEFTNFDCEHRLLKVLPELSDVETVAADPQWEISEKEVELPQNSSTRTMEDIPDAVELREVDHPIGYDDRTHASDDETATSKKKLPPWMDKDKKGDKKDDKKGDKKGDKEEKGKDDKKLPPWLKKKSKSDYSELYKKVSAEKSMGVQRLSMGDHVENINPDCKHFKSEGEVCGVRSLRAMRIKAADKPGKKEEEDELGFVFAYKTTNKGENWDEGDILEKTSDQLKKIKGMRRPI